MKTRSKELYDYTMKEIDSQIDGDIIAHVSRATADIIKAEVDRLRKESKALRKKIKAMEANNPH